MARIEVVPTAQIRFLFCFPMFTISAHFLSIMTCWNPFCVWSNLRLQPDGMFLNLRARLLRQSSHLLIPGVSTTRARSANQLSERLLRLLLWRKLSDNDLRLILLLRV